VLIFIPIIISFLVSSVFWLLAKNFLSALSIKPFKSSFTCTLISVLVIVITNVEMPMGILSVLVTLTVLNLIISMLVLLSISFYRSFVVKIHNKPFKQDK